MVGLGVGNGLQNAAGKADDAADGGRHNRQHQRAAHAAEIIYNAVFGPESRNVGGQLWKF